MIIEFSQFAIDERQFFIDFLTDNIPAYKISKLTNGNCGDLPSINAAHPLALEYGALISSSDADNYTSLLPAIGVELLDDGEDAKQYMGMGGMRPFEITQAWITSALAVPIKERFKNGLLISDESLAAIQAMKTDIGPTEALYGIRQDFFQSQEIAISLWSDHPDKTRVIFMVLRSILKKAKIEASKLGVKNLNTQGQQAIYNYEFGKTLYGAEFNITFLNTVTLISVDSDIITMKSVNEFINDPIVKQAAKFVPLSEQ